MPHAQADPLLRPLWAALIGAQAHLADSNGRARRFRPSVNAFVAAGDDGAGALADVAALVPPGEKVYTVQADPVPDIPGLTTLLRRPGEVVPKRDLLREVWGDDFTGDGNVLEVYMGYLRRKVDAPFGRRSLQTVRGAGYKMVDPAA